MRTLVATITLDVFLAMARAVTLVWVHGSCGVAWTWLTAWVVPIAALALVTLWPGETLAANTIPRMQTLLNVGVIPYATPRGARSGAGALAAGVAVIPRHTPRAEVTVFTMFTVNTGSVMRTVLADSATAVLSKLVYAGAAFCYFSVIDTRCGMAKALAFFTLCCIAGCAHPPWLLVEQWAAALAARATRVVFTATLQLST